MGKRKIVHTVEPAFLAGLRSMAAPLVFRGRANLRPRRCWSSKWVTHMVLACMMREGFFNPRACSIGALGISRETAADLVKEGRITTRAAPAEMLRAVANSRKSLPLSSRARRKTGMASCNRAHLRCSLCDILRGTCSDHHKEVKNGHNTASEGPNQKGYGASPFLA